MRKKIKIFIKIIVILFFIFYTESTYTDNTYQDMLYSTKGKVDRNNDKFGGLTFKFGGNIDDIKPWKRIRIGYPIKAITIDYQNESKITQGRIHIDMVIINLVCAVIILFLLKWVIIKPLKLIKSVIDDSRIFKKNSR